MSDSVLPLPDGTVLRTEDGSQVIVEKYKNRGGEGYLHPVKDSPDQVAKIYHIPIGSREQKLKDMVANNPNIKRVCWPTHLLYDQNGEFVGFLMPKLPEEAVSVRESVFRLAQEERVLPGWDRKDITNTAKIVAEMISKLHERGILMGDINDRNVMLDPGDKSAVYLVDCDSYQFKNYPCPVGSKEYTHPGIYKRLGVSGALDFSEVLRTEDEDNYALGILIYRILLLGRHPFRRVDKPLLQAMRERSFPDRDKETDARAKFIRINLYSRIEEEFINTFRDQKPTKAYKWARILGGFLEFYDKDNFEYTRELLPYSPKDYHLDNGYFVDGYLTCERCGVEFKMPKREWEERLSLGEPLLCPYCDDDVEIEIECSEEKPKCARSEYCKNTVELTKAVYIKWEKNEAVYCKECSEKVKIICDGCGKPGKEFKWKVKKNEKTGGKNLCYNCFMKEKGGN